MPAAPMAQAASAPRCRRHLARRGVRHWHVDWLTHEAGEINVTAFPEESECALVERLAGLPGITFPIPRFGSSDCRRCAAHLLNVAAPEIVEAFCQTISRQRQSLSRSGGTT